MASTWFQDTGCIASTIVALATLAVTVARFATFDKDAIAPAPPPFPPLSTCPPPPPPCVSIPYHPPPSSPTSSSSSNAKLQNAGLVASTVLAVASLAIAVAEYATNGEITMIVPPSPSFSFPYTLSPILPSPAPFASPTPFTTSPPDTVSPQAAPQHTLFPSPSASPTYFFPASDPTSDVSTYAPSPSVATPPLLPSFPPLPYTTPSPEQSSSPQASESPSSSDSTPETSFPTPGLIHGPTPELGGTLAPGATSLSTAAPTPGGAVPPDPTPFPAPHLPPSATPAPMIIYVNSNTRLPTSAPPVSLPTHAPGSTLAPGNTLAPFATLPQVTLAPTATVALGETVAPAAMAPTPDTLSSSDTIAPTVHGGLFTEGPLSTPSPFVTSSDRDAAAYNRPDEGFDWLALGFLLASIFFSMFSVILWRRKSRHPQGRPQEDGHHQA